MALLGAAIAYRDELSFHYHVWRLDRALTLEDARPWLAKLENDVQDPARAQRLVAMLGPRWPRLTLWTFQWQQMLNRDALQKGNAASFYLPVGGLRHFKRALGDRLRRDEGFHAVMAHFIRWNKALRTLLNRGERLRVDPAVGRFVEAPAGQGNATVPVPAEPLPGWTGPVPQLGPQF